LSISQELDVADAGDFDRILEAEEHASGGAFVGFEVEQILSVEGDRAFGHLIAGAAAEDVAERRLARAVRTHDRMDLARVDGEAEALEDRLAVDLGVEVFDFQHQRERFFFE
jgi:D-tyrosyl-tRNA(Tyr) deacylase